MVFLIVITLFPHRSVAAATAGAYCTGHYLGCCAAFILAGAATMFRDDLLDGSLEQLMLLPLPSPAVVLAKVMAHWMVTGLPLLILSPLVAMRPGMDVYGWQVMALRCCWQRYALAFLVHRVWR
ncbi:heme exporter protein CcmB [Escherichia coli]